MASTWTPKPVVSGSGGRAWGLERDGANRKFRPAKNAECGMRNAECKWRRRASNDPSLQFRIPHSALRIRLAPRRIDRRHQADLRHIHPRGLRHRSEEHTSELQSLAYLVCRLLLEKKKK